jgi:hypothetical protein
LAKPGARQYCSAKPTGVKMPPFETWPDLSSDLKKLYQPKLEKFWCNRQFESGCVLKEPKEQIEWKDL